MSDLTPETLAELQRLLDEAKRRLSSPRRAGKTYAMEALRNAAVNALPGLLGAATERDALHRRLVAVELRVEDALRHGYDLDPQEIASALGATPTGGAS